MKPLRIVWLLVLALLPACGGGGGGPSSQSDCPPKDVDLRVVASIPTGGVGSCDRCATPYTVILIRSDLPAGPMQRVAAHELGHAAGLAHDFEQSPCVMDSDTSDGNIALCQAEINAMIALRQGQPTLQVYATGAGLGPAMAASEAWNQATGMPLFLVVNGAPP